MMHDPVSHRRPWTPEEDEELRRRCEAGEFIPQIARAMGRTQEACRSRANLLGIPCRSSARQKYRSRPKATMEGAAQQS